jgi:hypothetical protein
MKNFYIVLVLCFSFFQLQAQKVDYDNTSKWFMGFNIGGTWNTTDVKNQTSTGWGLVLGKSFNYNYGSVISFDLRARYLRGMWYGQDNDTTSLLNYTGTALNDYTNVDGNTGPGFTVNNFQADVHRVALELALHLNSIRERSGWDPYIFGGVGLTFNQTFGDLLDQNGSQGIYDYSSMLANGSLAPQLSSNLDKIYDSPLDGSTNAYKAYFMPSLGFGLGYQIGKRVSLGLEHKTTFTRGDDFDGFVSTTPRLKNDLYHYTSLYLNFRFRTRGNGNTTTPTDGTNSTGNINNFNTNCPAPVISFNSQNNLVVNFPQFKLDASVTELQNAQNVTVYNNLNQIVPSNYNTVTKRVTADLVLVEGVNTITIKAQNNCGTDTKTFTVTYNPCVAAKVTFTNPVQVTTVKNANFTVNAIINNVANVANIRFYENNIQVNAFSFDPISGLFTSNVLLIPGLNTFRIEATNLCGTVTSSASVSFDNCVTPTVQLITPSATGTTTSNANITIQAFLKNVLSNQNATLTQNGVQVTNFTITNGQLIFPTTLVNGINTFTITVTSSCGNATETFNINYQNCAAPVVTVTNPVNNTTLNTAALVFKSRIDNIAGKQNASLKLNGIDITNFTYNATTKLVQASLQLQPGMNVITLGAINNCGSDIETIYVNYDNCIAPNVLIANTNTTVTNAAFVLNATLQNMADAQGISLTQNGNPVNFNYFNSQLTSALTLVPGNNTFVLTATKACGTSSKTLVINYNNCVAPSVFILNPTASGSVVNASTLAFKASVTNISNAQQIVLKQNNQVIPFNYNNGLIEANATLSNGVNNFQITVTNACGTDTKSTSISFVNCTPPSIAIVSPVMNNTTINYSQFQFKATISGSTNAQAVGLKVNGQDVTFNLASSVLTANLNLVPGVNSIIVSASNSCGTVIETSTINYDNCIQPSIQFNGITNTTQTVTNPNFNVSATIVGIQLASNISFTQNGQSKSFNFSNSNFTANLQLVEGLNTITLTSTNSCGVAIKTLNITLNTCVPPSVSFVNPSASGSTVATAAYNFKATVQNIANVQGISLKQNGATISNFSFVNGQIAANVTLQAGLNTFTVVATNACGVATETTSITLNNCVPPTVAFINPSASGSTVATAAYNFKATVQNIANAQGISLKQNGATISNFSFVNGQISANVTLQAGLNTFTVVATNACGVATETTSITLNNCVPPTVAFVNPSASGSTVATAAYNFKATVQNITSAQGISLKQNGATISNFSFVNGQISANVTLQAGLNTFTVVATNACGVATETTSITFDNCVPPTVNFTNPSTSGVTVSRPSFNLEAVVQNMPSTNGISFSQNGTTLSNFTVNNNQLSSAVTLQDGLNTFVIVATNTCGTATQTITVNYSSCVTPVVAITNPSNGAAAVSTAGYNFTATIQNITSAQGISLKLNGTTISNFTFANGNVQANVTLTPGLNTFVLTATNACGTVMDTKTITFNNCVPPTASITSPSANGTTVSSAGYNFTATVQNITSAQGISLKLNGTTISNFTFNNGTVQASVNLQAGLNTFILTATNACGTVTDTKTITFNNCVPPTASITSLSANGTTVSSAGYNFTATVQNITSAQGISLKLNGTTISNFTFNNGTVQANVNLVPGLNTFVLIVTNACGTATETQSVTFNNCVAPTAVINSPSANGTTVNASAYNFTASVQNITSAQGISLKLNGNTISNFTFANGNIQANVTLQEGLNTFVLIATNACGTVTETRTAIYACQLPTIVFNPTISRGSTLTYFFSATVTNVPSQQGINFTLNNAPVTDYTYQSGNIQTTLTLQNGANTVRITATNLCGTATRDTVINFGSCDAPVINFASPSAAGTTVNAQSFSFNANVDNMTSAQGITLKLNNVSISNLNYSNGTIQKNVTLQPGLNTFVLSAVNNCGNSSETITVNYVNCIAPTIAFVKPATNASTVTNALYNFSAAIANVTNPQGIGLQLNGVNIAANFSNGLLQATVTLQPGNNTFTVSAINECGNANLSTTLIYQNCIAPVINNTTSPASGSTTSNTSLSVSAVIQNYTPETVVQVKVNGNVVSAYSNNNGIITGNLPLQNGMTTLEISATNACGTDTDVYTITRCKPSTFSLINPAARNSTVSTPNQVIQFNLFNVDAQTAINISQNGTPNNNFSLNGQTVVGNVTLVPGVNTFTISVVNACNQLSETITINYITSTSPNTPSNTSPNSPPSNNNRGEPNPSNENNNGGQRVNNGGKVNATPSKDDGKINNGGKTPSNSGTVTTPPKNPTSTPSPTVTKPAATKVNTDTKGTTPTVKDPKKVEAKPTEKEGTKGVETPKPKTEIKPQIKGGGR